MARPRHVPRAARPRAARSATLRCGTTRGASGALIAPTLRRDLRGHRHQTAWYSSCFLSFVLDRCAVPTKPPAWRAGCGETRRPSCQPSRIPVSQIHTRVSAANGTVHLGDSSVCAGGGIPRDDQPQLTFTRQSRIPLLEEHGWLWERTPLDQSSTGSHLRSSGCDARLDRR